MHSAKFPCFDLYFWTKIFLIHRFRIYFWWARLDLQHIAVGVGVRLRACIEATFKIGTTKGSTAVPGVYGWHRNVQVAESQVIQF